MVNFLHGAPATPDLNVKPSGLSMTVDEELKTIRPVIYGAVVRGVDLPDDGEATEEFIKGLMDHQEKLHFALGRGRKRASIGVHDMSALQAPFRVTAVPGSTEFTPLGETSPMTISAM